MNDNDLNNVPVDSIEETCDTIETPLDTSGCRLRLRVLGLASARLGKLSTQTLCYLRCYLKWAGRSFVSLVLTDRKCTLIFKSLR